MIRPSLINKLCSELNLVNDLEVINLIPDRERFSRDFFEYSPVLEQKLKGCLADLVVRPHSVNAVIAVVIACKKLSVPLTLRGSGTGNYGQSVPLKGGVVMLMSELSRIRNFNSIDGVITVEPGCLLKDIDQELASHGRQLRLLPSTWKSASVGGFIAGGSGGIGSVRWGFLRDPGHLLGLEIITLDNQPRKIELDANEAQALNHGYGTNGIITSLTLATTPTCDWQEVTIDCTDWNQALDLLNKCSCAALNLNLCTLLEKQILKVIPNWSGSPSNHIRILILVSPDGVSTIERIANCSFAKFTHLGPENLKKGSGLRELSWNHTTLHMRAIDPNWTYLQMLLPNPEMPFISALKNRWGENLLWHLEGVRQQGSQRIAALPLVRWQGIELLEELIRDCKQLGAIIFNPHVITVEDGGLGVIDIDQVEAKRKYDPSGLLNPGKLRGWN